MWLETVFQPLYNLVDILDIIGLVCHALERLPRHLQAVRQWVEEEEEEEEEEE